VLQLFISPLGKLLDLKGQEMDAERVGATAVGANYDRRASREARQKKRNRHPPH